MKKIISGKELRDKTCEAINILCDTVKQTLGPKGYNVIIDHSNFSPFITNDGVTIAQNIESDDPVLGGIIELAKEASIKTNENVGDGTTTTLVLLQALINNGYALLDSGKNSQILKNELNLGLKEILTILNNMKKNITQEMIEMISTVSANDDEMGKLASEVTSKVDNKSAILIKEDFHNILKVNYIKGYSCSVSHPLEYYFQDKNSFSFQNACVLIINDIMENVESIDFILNDIIDDNRCLILIAKDFDSYFINEIMSLNLDNKVNCFMVRLCECGLRERYVQKDIEILTKGIIVENIQHITNANVEVVKNLYVDREILRLDFEVDSDISDYNNKLIEDLNKCDYFDLDFFEKRVAMFTQGLAEVIIGAPTKVEVHEKRMRFDDALSSAYASKNGYLLGGGVSLLNASAILNDDTDGNIIWKKALLKPFEQIMENSALPISEISSEIVNSNYSKVYNVHTDSYENSSNTKIIDAFDVVVNSLTNACSIAVMLLTTNSLVINEHVNNMNKVNEYTEL